MVDNYKLDEVLDRIKEIIGIEKFDNTKILVDKDDKLPDDVTKNMLKYLMTFIITDDGKFYPQLFLEESLFLK